MKMFTAQEVLDYFKKEYVDVAYDTWKKEREAFKHYYADVSKRYMGTAEKTEYKEEERNIKELKTAYENAKQWLIDQKNEFEDRGWLKEDTPVEEKTTKTAPKAPSRITKKQAIEALEYVMTGDVGTSEASANDFTENLMILMRVIIEENRTSGEVE